MKLELERRSLRLLEPLHTAYGVVRERQLAVVQLTGEAEGASPYTATNHRRSPR